MVMKILLILLGGVYTCFADELPKLYGTIDNPQINGVTYDLLHKAYIEPNQGMNIPRTIESEDNKMKDVSKIVVKSLVKPSKQAMYFKSDAWAKDLQVEKVLKKAASDGKLSYVLEQAKKANVPASVAIVPIVETNYNKDAVSHAGAGGAWQLMPGTANDYGLSSTDRFDFNSSTNVAIQILTDLYHEFGNWALAFAAYNCGSQCVINALKKNPNAKDIDDLSLPRETKNYVHKIVQLNQLIAGLDKINNIQKNNKGAY
jgi:hypothetical protein